MATVDQRESRCTSPVRTLVPALECSFALKFGAKARRCVAGMRKTCQPIPKTGQAFRQSRTSPWASITGLLRSDTRLAKSGTGPPKSGRASKKSGTGLLRTCTGLRRSAPWLPKTVLLFAKAVPVLEKTGRLPGPSVSVSLGVGSLRSPFSGRAATAVRSRPSNSGRTPAQPHGLR